MLKNKYFQVIITLLFCVNAIGQSNTTKVKVEMKVTERKAPDPVKPLDFNKMSQELSSSFNNNQMTREQRIAAKEKYYFESLNFISNYVCTGNNVNFNQKIVDGQNEARESVQKIYSEMTSGSLAPTEYYFVNNTCISNYKDFIMKCDLINQSLQMHLNSYIQKNQSDIAQNLDDDFSKYIDQILIDYSIKWIKKNKNFNTIESQQFSIRKSNINLSNGSVILDVMGFYTDATNYLKGYDSADSKPLSYDVLYQSGQSKHKLNDYLASLQDFEDAEKLNPSDSVYCMIAREKFYLKRYSESYTASDMAIRRNNLNNEAFYWRANVKVETKDLQGALLDFNTAISLKNDHFLYFYWRAELKTKLEDYTGALDDFNRALTLKPSDAKTIKRIEDIELKIK